MLAPQTTALRKIKSASNKGEQYKHSFTLHWDKQDVWKNRTKTRLRFTAQLSPCFHQKHNMEKKRKKETSTCRRHVLGPQENTIKKQECQILQRRLGAQNWPLTTSVPSASISQKGFSKGQGQWKEEPGDPGSLSESHLLPNFLKWCALVWLVVWLAHRVKL